MAEELRIEYMALGDLVKRYHPQNPKQHDIGAIIQSIETFGYVTPGVIDETTGFFAEGHGRTEALQRMKHDRQDAPKLIEVRKDDWYVPVFRGIAFKDDVELKAFLVAANRTNERGGWDETLLLNLLEQIQAERPAILDATGYDAQDLQAMIDLSQPILPAEYGPAGEAAAQIYAEGNVKQIVLYFDAEEYLVVVDKFKELRAAQHLETNTDAVVYLLEQYGQNTGEAQASRQE